MEQAGERLARLREKQKLDQINNSVTASKKAVKKDEDNMNKEVQGGLKKGEGKAIRIADLCDEDKAKIAKLMQQLVKVGQENERLVKQMDEEREVMQNLIF
jgi:hypothetical protein